MESILTIDAKANPEIVEDFDGMEVGDKVRVVSECTISELSSNRVSLPLENIVSITGIGESSSDDEEEDEEEEGES
jgi:hypothetical protein